MQQQTRQERLKVHVTCAAPLAWPFGVCQGLLSVQLTPPRHGAVLSITRPDEALICCRYCQPLHFTASQLGWRLSVATSCYLPSFSQHLSAMEDSSHLEISRAGCPASLGESPDLPKVEESAHMRAQTTKHPSKLTASRCLTDCPPPQTEF